MATRVLGAVMKVLVITHEVIVTLASNTRTSILAWVVNGQRSILNSEDRT